MFHTSYIEISRSALRTNIDFLRKRMGSNVRFCSVIKGNAYGHGIEHFLPMVEHEGVDQFAVFSADEALRADRIRSEQTDLMIMGMVEGDELEWAIHRGISFFVFETDRLQQAIAIARKRNLKARIHIELETGMNRTGFEEEQLDEVAEMINQNREYLEIEGICTHYAGAESIGNYLRIQNQIKNYDRMTTRLCELGVEAKYRHTACSAAALSYPETIMQMVRVGIAQYGFWPSQETYMRYAVEGHKIKTNPLKRVISWKSRVLSVKKVKAGEFINYGTSFMASREMRIATVPVGYTYGFDRDLSNVGRVLVRGRRASVVGVVNMNMMTVDVTNCPGVTKGDEVVIIGNQKKNSITVDSFSEMTRNVTYETLVRLPHDIPRLIVR